MDMGFLDACTGNLDELCLGAQIINGCAAEESHSGAETAHLLQDDVLERSLVRNSALDSLGNKLVLGVVGLEVAVG